MREWAEWLFGEYEITKEAFDKEEPVQRERLKWLFPVFESGRRHCHLAPEEWDFRAVKDLQEARRVSRYEYRREVSRLYEWEADCMKFVGKYHADVVLLKMALEHKWTRAPDPWLLLSEDANLFPTPWLKLPAEIRRLKYEPVRAAYSITFDAEDRKLIGYQERAHAVVIQWHKPDAEIKRDLAKLVDELRPPELPRVKPPRGRRIAKPFDELKWLSAWRLASAGLSYEQAQGFLKKHAPSGDPHGVIPRYASAGAWQSHALDKARNLITGMEKRCR